MSTQSQSTPALVVGMLLFPGLTLLDLAGPYEVFSRMPKARVHLVAARIEPISSEKGVPITPDTSFDDAPSFDILFVPGGPGQLQVMEDDRFLSFLREKSQAARLITSVCEDIALPLIGVTLIYSVCSAHSRSRSGSLLTVTGLRAPGFRRV